MGWSPLATLGVVAGVWITLCALLACGLSRWFRWMRGDFDHRE